MGPNSIIELDRRATRAEIPPMEDHRPHCGGHIFCPGCRRRCCARAVVINRDGTARRVVCLECRTAYAARPVIGG